MALEDNAGNVLGPRGTFTYETDQGVTYNITQDRSVGEAVGNTISTNAALPVLPISATKPIKPRYILVVDSDEPTKRKKIVIGDPTNSLFASAASATVTINGETFEVTGRVGEKRSTLRLTPAPDPA